MATETIGEGLTQEQVDARWEAMKTTNRVMSREQFCRRFKARMVAAAPFTKFDDGMSVEDYADITAPTYYAEDSQREEGPEECAEADMSYWGE